MAKKTKLPETVKIGAVVLTRVGENVPCEEGYARYVANILNRKRHVVAELEMIRRYEDDDWEASVYFTGSNAEGICSERDSLQAAVKEVTARLKERREELKIVLETGGYRPRKKAKKAKKKGKARR